MADAIIANHKPYYKELKIGRKYYWCACGRSRRQPFCDGSHKGTGIEPVELACTTDGEEVLFCGCKQTKTPPFCDGTHNNLPGGYEEGQLPDNLPWVTSDDQGIRQLDGDCYVVHPIATRPQSPPDWWLRTLVERASGSQHMAQFYGELRGEHSPVLTSTAGDIVLWTMEGTGQISISGRDFALAPHTGLYVRAGEAIQFKNEGDGVLSVYIAACPLTDQLVELDEMPTNFDDAWPERMVQIDAGQRNEMGPRFFQMLVDKSIGSTTATQFIGHIPQSQAEMHRHLYEEALIILSGEGVIWNDGTRARVAAGDVIFFPRKHHHSLECTSPEGMMVVGIIHPGDNPGINY